MFKDSTFGIATPSQFSVSTNGYFTGHFRKATSTGALLAADYVLQRHQLLSIHLWNVCICLECKSGIVLPLLGSFAVMSIKKMIFRL